MAWSRRLCAALSVVVGALGCGDDDASPDAPIDASPPAPDAGPTAPPFRNAVDLPDADLAAQALDVLEACDSCHAITRQNLRYWRALGDTSLERCLTDLEVASPDGARDMIDCLRVIPDDADSQFRPEKLGIYATGASLPWFQYLFEQAYGAAWEPAWDDFTALAGMPRGGPSLSQAEFDLLAEWTARGLPLLEALLPEDPPPTTCTPGVSADVAAHVEAMRTAGWSAVNEENGILMHGCAGASSARDCLSDYDRPSGAAAGWEHLDAAVLRLLRTEEEESAFWSRTSPDGRFVGHGLYAVNGSRFIDLQEDRAIPADQALDHSFFPDRSAFMVWLSGVRICPMTVLTSSPEEVTFQEAGCTGAPVSSYPNVGAALEGGDYWIVRSHIVGDDPGHLAVAHEDPPTVFGADSVLTLTPLVNEGSGFVAGTPIEKTVPFEGDAVVSPSSTLIIDRVAGSSGQLGYILRELVVDTSGGETTVEVPEIARYCASGGKAAFSYDERWVAFHHQVTAADAEALGFEGEDDPAFTPYLEQGGSNVYVIDLTTGTETRVTTMNPGQFALFPHFRSDGWIYFVVRDPAAGVEHVVASDAALLLAEP